MKRTRDVANEGDLNVVYHGKLYSFTYLAAMSFFSQTKAHVNYKSGRDLSTVLNQIIDGSSQYAVLPLESSFHGTILSLYDKLLCSEGRLAIVGEIGQLEEHCFCIAKDTNANDVDVSKVYCHPHIIECCSDYLDSVDSRRIAMGRPAIARIATWDSADACSKVASGEGGAEEGVAAAICSNDASKFNKLKIVARGIGNDKNTETRYVIVARRDAQSGALTDPLRISPLDPTSLRRLPSATGRGLKSSLALSLINESGSLFKMSSCFALRGVNISKIESRPSSVAIRTVGATAAAAAAAQGKSAEGSSGPGATHWDLIYYIDYAPSESEAVNAALLANLREYCQWVVELGTYASGVHMVEMVPTDWKHMIDTIIC